MLKLPCIQIRDVMDRTKESTNSNNMALPLNETDLNQR